MGNFNSGSETNPWVSNVAKGADGIIRGPGALIYNTLKKTFQNVPNTKSQIITRDDPKFGTIEITYTSQEEITSSAEIVRNSINLGISKGLIPSDPDYIGIPDELPRVLLSSSKPRISIKTTPINGDLEPHYSLIIDEEGKTAFNVSKINYPGDFRTHLVKSDIEERQLLERVHHLAKQILN